MAENPPTPLEKLGSSASSLESGNKGSRENPGNVLKP